VAESIPKAISVKASRSSSRGTTEGEIVAAINQAKAGSQKYISFNFLSSIRPFRIWCFQL